MNCERSVPKFYTLSFVFYTPSCFFTHPVSQILPKPLMCSIHWKYCGTWNLEVTSWSSCLGEVVRKLFTYLLNIRFSFSKRLKSDSAKSYWLCWLDFLTCFGVTVWARTISCLGDIYEVNKTFSVKYIIFEKMGHFFK